jgi:hypothetical protein
MKLVGLALVIGGWLLAVSGLQSQSVGMQLVMAMLGLTVSLGGIIGVLNPAHNKTAIWKR